MLIAAPLYTRIAESQSDELIASGDSITVYGISVQGTANGQVVIEQANSTTIILELSVSANQSAVMNIPFIASNGIQVTTPANVTCTVYHSNAGA